MLMKELYAKQSSLDEFIRRIKNITIPEEKLLSKVCLAALVELGEFAAERKNREKALYEYVDLFHFLLMINNILKLDWMVLYEFEDMYTSSQFPLKTSREVETIDVFESLTKLANKTRCFKYWSNKGPEDKLRLTDEYAVTMFNFMALGNYMKFTVQEVLEAYENKRNENFKRQEENY
jgi:dimeric dUTPase (all-alpha-NTP-PPase superfamily)